MASKLDYDALRAQTMGAGNDEAVTVNTRALIDKVLARYSGEWTTLRELLQNAADASASKVSIKFETLPSPTVPVPQSSESSARLKHVLVHHTLKSMIVENNGDAFQEHDWARLKKIAEGNPDETKIGAFGVGFYSVFADCEEPFVSSGQQALAFYWQKDALFTKRMTLPNGQSTNTTFVLPMRNQTSPIPPLLSLCQFLTSSLTFVGLESIEMSIDGWMIATLNKKIAPSLELPIPKEVDKKSREGLMQLTAVTKEAAQIDTRWLKVAEWKPKAASDNLKDPGSGSTVKAAYQAHSLRGFFSRLAPGASNHAALEKAAKEEQLVQESLEEDLLGEATATVFIHVNKANVRTAVNPNFAIELERATKKPPPKYTTVSLLSTSYDEQVASSSNTDKAFEVPKIFSTFVPTNGKGKIFIGFTTNQTTGLNIHISTPSVIPTVERESIDLNNRFVRVWNVELLRIAGIVSRVSWGHEMMELREKLARNVKLTGKEDVAGRRRISKENIDAVLPEALFLHNTFNFNESTPSAEVGTLIEEAFWTCNQKTTIATLSTQGVLPSSNVRISEELGFVDGIPTLPEALAGVGLIKKLIEYGVITPITMTDIKSELERKALSGVQLQKFLEWLGQKARKEEIDRIAIRSLLDVTLATDEEYLDGKLIELGKMENYVNVSRISPEMPVPPTTLPFKYTMKMSKTDLEHLGFEDLKIVPWLRWLVANIGGSTGLSADYDITESPGFANSVLQVISKQWDGLSPSSKHTVTQLLASRTVIPTKLGMKKPAEAYFPSVKLFDDLAVHTMQGVKEKFLSQLGVRKTVEIGVVFERLIDAAPSSKTQIPASSSKWSHVDLIKYLASVKDDIPPADITRLRSMKICPAETESLQPTKERYLVSELFEPDQAIRRLKLRTLQWPGIYRPESNEGRFLTFLGLRAAPSYDDLVNLISTAAVNQDFELRDRALRYFVDYHQTKGYAQVDHSSVSIPYLPVQGEEKKMATPSTCFSNDRASLLGFDILRHDLHAHASKFGVKPDPPMSECINRLIQSPPRSRRDAREKFSYFASRLSHLSNEQAERLGQAKIVPIESRAQSFTTAGSHNSQSLVHIAPQICFLGNGEKYADIFDYVDFGPEANTFLLRTGSKHEPSTTELTRLLVREPARIFSVLGDSRYLELLRSVAASWRTLRKDKTLVKDMKNSKCLLAYREIYTPSDQEEDEDSGIKVWELATAKQIVIVDDIITYKLFKSSLLACPMEETLEDFYHSLESPELASLLEEHQNIGMIARDETQALKLQQLIPERARLFLADYQRESIKHDAKWIEQNLRVKCVKSILLRKSLKGYLLSHTEPRSAVLHNDKPILYVTTGHYEMLEVSQALVPVLLHRAKPQAMFMFEMILESTLPKLRSRGYNVARLLNQRATEARIAEEARMRQLAEEERELKERETAWKQSQAANAAKAQKQIPMPGVFPDSPDRQHAESSRQTPAAEDEPLRSRPRGFLSGISRQFGFDRHLSHHHHSTNRGSDRGIETPQEDVPPPYSQQDGQKSQTKIPQPETVTAPHQLQQNLVNAIQRSRAHNSTSVASQPSVNEVKETASYCDSRPGQDITLIGEITGVRVFLSNTVAINGMPAAKFLEANASALKLFASVLLDCADVFSLKRSTVHMFYDDAGSTIAFNQDRALFFNYRYFDNLHLPVVQQGNKTDAIVYWSVVMAHELAHNLVSDHSAQHSYYTEAMVVQYFPKMVIKTAGQQSSTSREPGSVLPSDPLQSRS